MLEAGTAYQQVYNWLVGSTLATPCSATGTQWTCTFTRPGGYQAEVIWDTSQSCTNGTCTTVDVSVDLKYSKNHDLAGNSGLVSNSTVAVGLKPIWLTNQ